MLFFVGLYRGTDNGTDRHRVRVGLRARAKVRLRLGVASGLRLGGGSGGSVPVATPDSVHSTCIQLQLTHHTTTSYPHPS